MHVTRRNAIKPPVMTLLSFARTLAETLLRGFVVPLVARPQIDDFQPMVCLWVFPGGTFGQHHQPLCQPFAPYPLPRKRGPVSRTLLRVNR